MPHRHRLRPAWAPLLAALLTLAACGGGGRRAAYAPAVPALRLELAGPASFADWMHAPLRPGNGEPITFSAELSVEEGFSRVELYVYEYELYRNRADLPSQRPREGGVWGRVRTWDFAAAEGPRARATTELTLDHVHQLGFPAHTRVEYVWRAIDLRGAPTDRFARFDAGDSPWPEDKVLLYSASRRPMSDVVDISFFRDTDYGDSVDVYDRDVEAMLNHGFFGSRAIGDHRDHWAFYTTDRVADGARISANIADESLLPAFLKDFSVPGIDAFCLVHREDYTDRSLLLENFHSLSNNLFSAEAHNWGTAVHECGHAVFHLSDEYGGCACFQTHNTSNVFRERSDCAEWNLANGFPADDCFELRDLYRETWYSAEEPTFFTSERACRDHNRKQGVDTDSCRTFVNAEGRELYWAFETTCIMHDDGDAVVRDFQRACSRVIDDFYDRLRENRSATGDLAAAAFANDGTDNLFGYEEVIVFEMERQDDLWSLRVRGAEQGVPTAASGAGGEVVMRVLDEAGVELADYRLARPGAVHAHAADGAGADDAFAVPSTGVVRIAVPADRRIARVVCEYDPDKTPDPTGRAYREPFLFEVGDAVRAALSGQ